MKVSVFYSDLSVKRENKKSNQELHHLITKCVDGGINNSVCSQKLSKHHPWCFVLPTSKPDQFYVGAFSLLNESRVVVLYAKVSSKWILKNLTEISNIAFWCTRILSYLIKDSECSINEDSLNDWAKSLQRFYSPLLEMLILNSSYRFKNSTDLLTSENTYLDCEINDDGGINVMPWKSWPSCIKSSDSTWLWRLNRQGKILDSHKITINDELNRTNA